MVRILLIAAVFLTAVKSTAQVIDYPETPRRTVIDTFFSKVILDDYRWLEGTDEEVNTWVKQQNDIARKYLRKTASKYSTYVPIQRYSRTKYSKPSKIGDYYYTYSFYNSVGLPALFFRRSIEDTPDLLIDPNFVSGKDNIYIGGIASSKDSKFLAYKFSRNGSDWMEIKVVKLPSGTHLKDHLLDVKHSGIQWRGNGFYYSKYPRNDLNATLDKELITY